MTVSTCHAPDGSIEVRVTLEPHELAELTNLVAERIRDDLPAANPWPEWMSIDTAARYLDCTVERVRKLVARGQIPYHQEGPGCRIFFRRSDLDLWMTGNRQQVRG